MFQRYLLVCLSLCGFFCAHTQQIGRSVDGTFALTNGTIIAEAGDTIRGTVLIREGKIAGVGSAVQIPREAKTIDCTGRFIYPGMIDSGTYLGLSEIESISLTRDQNEVGNILPHVHALTAVNPNSVLIPVARVNGVTTVLAKPSGGRISGTAALIHLHGYTPAQMYAGCEAIVMNFPGAAKRGRFDRRSEEEIKKEFDKEMKALNDVWEKTKLYNRIDSAGASAKLDYQPEVQAMVPVIRGEQLLLIEVDDKTDILNALKWIKEQQVSRVALSGVAEGWRVADSIAAAGIPVITGPVLSIPGRASDRYDASYTNAGVMAEAGVKVAIRTNGTENVRNLPYEAGFAAAYGMGREAALQAVTTVPAEIFGVSEMLGSIQVGKVADLFVCDGDPFETQTQISHLFISGWEVPLESRHTLLYDEFIERSPGLHSHE